MPRDGATGTIGIIFPFLPKHPSRFFDEKKTVFVKFFGNERSPLRIRPGSKLFIYESEGNKEIVGEAIISGIEMGTADEVLTKYGRTLFLTQQELDEYTDQRKEKKMLILTVKNAKRYKTPLRLEKSVTMAGRYMTKQMFQDLQTRVLNARLRPQMT